MVSHDRDLLNDVCDHIVHIDQQKLVTYNGNYDRFERTRAERLEHDAAQQAKIAAQRKHMQAFVDRFKAKASKARQAQSRVKMIEKLGPIATVPIDERIAFNFPPPEQLASPIETLDEVTVGYGDGPPVLRKLDLRLDMDDRIALLGQNGNGKSTFIRLLSDRLQPREGKVKRTPRLRIGYFSQDQEESLDYEATPFQHMSSALGPAAGETKVRAQLGRFGFSRDRADLKVGVLSGGEKTRLLLSLATRNAPHLLLLDEPTNHLDMDARASLVDAINDFEGAVVLVSHDTHLVKMVADQLWVVADGKVTPFDGDIDDYQAKLLRERNGGKGRQGRQARAARERSASARTLRPDPRRRRISASSPPTRAPSARRSRRPWKRWRRISPGSTSSAATSRPGLPIPAATAIPRSTSPSYSETRSGWSARSPTPSTSGWSRRKPTRRRDEFIAGARPARRSFRRRRPRHGRSGGLTDGHHQGGVHEV